MSDETCDWCGETIPGNGDHDSYDCGCVLLKQRDEARSQLARVTEHGATIAVALQRALLDRNACKREVERLRAALTKLARCAECGMCASNADCAALKAKGDE